MSAIKGFLYKNKKIIIFIILIIISFILLFSSKKEAVVKVKKEGFKLFSPFYFIVNSTGSFFVNTFNSISELKKSQKELKNVRNELEQYKKIIIDFNAIKNENIQLKRILDLKDEVVYESVACEVIGRDPEKLFDILILNKGKRDGIKENMPVISYASGKKVLVGKVVEVTYNLSKIITLHNPKFAASTVILKNDSRIHTIIQGSNKMLGIVKLLYIPKRYFFTDSDLDFIYTSGDSLIFPKGLEIGRIVKLYTSKRYEMYNEADVQMSVDLSKLDYVLVLKVEYNKDDFNLLKE
jgi:rod shape-determining protein MreC